MHSKTGWATSLSDFNPGKLPLLVAILSRELHYSTNSPQIVIFKKI
jgi:hypothetical protein